MTFSQYLQSKFYQRTLSRRSISKKKNRFDLIFALCFLLLSVAALIVLYTVPEHIKTEGWFIAIVTSVSLGCLVAAGLIELIFFLRSHTRLNNFLDPELGAGILLLVRELPVDIGKSIKDCELTLPVRYDLERDKVRSVTFGEKEFVSLDLSPWGDVESESVLGIAALPVLEYLMKADVYSLSLRTVSLLPSLSDGINDQPCKPVLLVKKGKWTLLGRMLRWDYRKTLKILSKMEAENDR